MNIVTFPVGQLQANSYLCEVGGRCICVDPGDDADMLLDHVLRNNWTLSSILLTHGHFDHCLAVGEIQTHLPEVPCYIHPADHFLLERLLPTAAHFLGHAVVALPPKLIRDIRGYSDPLFGFTIMETPGHTPGGVCLHDSSDNIVFTGDVLFLHSTGRTDFSYGNKSEMQRSLANLFLLPSNTIVYPGHGEPTTIGNEKKRLRL